MKTRLDHLGHTWTIGPWRLAVIRTRSLQTYEEFEQGIVDTQVRLRQQALVLGRMADERMALAQRVADLELAVTASAHHAPAVEAALSAWKVITNILESGLLRGDVLAAAESWMDAYGTPRDG